MINNTVYQFLGSNLGVEIFLEKRGHQKWVRRLRLLCILYIWGFKKIPFSLYTYVLAKILQNGAMFIQKLTPGFKNQMKNLETSSAKFKTLKFDGLLLSKKCICPKNTFLQLKDYIQRIYLTLLSTTCVKIHQITRVIFETKSHFSRHNSFVFF